MIRYRMHYLLAALAAVALGTGVASAQMTGGGTSGGSSSGGSSSGASSGGGSSGAGGFGSQGFGPGSLGGSQGQGQNFAPKESATTTTNATKNGNPFNAYYANPMAMGLPGTTSGAGTGPGYRPSGSAGAASGPTTLSATLYPNIYTNTTGTTGSRGNFGGSGLGGRPGAQSGISGGSGTGTRSYGYVIANVTTNAPTITNNPQYTPVASPEFRIGLQQVIARSSNLASRDGIVVLTEGPMVVLRGTVASDRDRRLAENVLRLTPGVRDIRNELEIAIPPSPAP